MPGIELGPGNTKMSDPASARKPFFIFMVMLGKSFVFMTVVFPSVTVLILMLPFPLEFCEPMII